MQEFLKDGINMNLLTVIAMFLGGFLGSAVADYIVKKK